MKNDLNGANPYDKAQPDMTPAERKVWLASHAAPSQYMLVTVAEMQVMMDGQVQQRELCDALNRQFRRVEKILLGYWKTEPDLVNGVAAAVFDAGKYTKLAKLLPPHLRKMRDQFKAIREMVTPHVGDATKNELHELGEKIVEAIDLLETQEALRRDRRATT